MLAERDFARILLYDRDRERAQYVASDLAETVFSGGYTRRVSSVSSMRDLAGCDVILISAGRSHECLEGDPPTPEELFRDNRALVKEIAETFTGSSTLFVVASEPVDLLTAELVKTMRLPFSRVLGLGGVLDSYRIRHILGEKMQFNPDYIRSQVVGPHDASLIPLWDFTSINGIPIRSIVDESILTQAEETFTLGCEDHTLDSVPSRYTPAMACADLLDSIVRDDRRILSTTVVWENVLGVSGVAMSIPCVIGRLGAERIVVPELNEAHQRRITNAAATYGAILEGAQA